MLEICIDSVASARAAADGGADRVELCAALPEGGTTPSAGMIKAVRRAFPAGLMVIIRPRGYDFLYTADELDTMLADIDFAVSAGVDGVVLGCLTPDGRVDKEKCQRLLDRARGLDVTFHRAFDMSRDLNEALEDIIELGIPRILTSGGMPDVPSGAHVIRELITQADGRISIMPGGGITADNLTEIVAATGARDYHLSARKSIPSGMTFRNPGCSMGEFTKTSEYEWRTACTGQIARCQQILSPKL